jgi:hypothetical protein
MFGDLALLAKVIYENQQGNAYACIVSKQLTTLTCYTRRYVEQFFNSTVAARALYG